MNIKNNKIDTPVNKKIKKSLKVDVINDSSEKIVDDDETMNSVMNIEVYFKEMRRFQQIVRDTLIHLNKLKTMDIINGNEMNQCLQSIEKINDKIEKLQVLFKNTKYMNDTPKNDIKKTIFDILQSVNNDLALLFRSFGTHSIREMLNVCLGNTYVSNIERLTANENGKYMKWKQILESVHPINYKTIVWKSNMRNGNTNASENTSGIRRNRIVDDNMIMESANTLDCFDLARVSKDFNRRVYGIKIAFQDEEKRRTFIVCGVVDDIPVWTFGTDNLVNLEKDIVKQLNSDKLDIVPMNSFVSCLTLKDILVYSTEELGERFVGYTTQALRLHRMPLNTLVSEFIGSECYIQRNMLLQLLTMNHKPEYQYLAYLLFDLLSSETSNVVDTHEQTTIFDSLPTKAKQFFKEALKKTVQYTNNLSNFDANKIPLEQQICLMKANDNVKERAMQKLKELKNKSEDSGAKARQYIEGLLKIPFGIYREEPILSVMSDVRSTFNNMIARLSQNMGDIVDELQIPRKTSYTGLEVAKYTAVIKAGFDEKVDFKTKELLQQYISSRTTREELTELITQLNGFIRFIKTNAGISGGGCGNSNGLQSDGINEWISSNIDTVSKMRKIPSSGQNINHMTNSINNFISSYANSSLFARCLVNYLQTGQVLGGDGSSIHTQMLFDTITNDINRIETSQANVKKYIEHVNKTLTNSVHGHDNAKRQIERIIGQWINGEKTGYCFGFEGAPGLGKTSLAKKGIANCLIDENGTPRPFTFIAIGGASNGSTLEGHNYTYVASTWGRIVDILMEKKCMNPIIFIDELDKVSHTEHGREIIGILTHLIDPTQNDTFQDKYFNGIDIDLSKALFIFSYNDVELIDRILLDRIHRIKFSALTLDDKLIICKNYLMPEILEKMGMENVVSIPDETMIYIIEKYTNEPGVRKLREILFEIVGEINVEILREQNMNMNMNIDIPFVVSIDAVKNKYLKDRDMLRPYKICREVATVGVINGLYANSLGRGGVLPIEVSFLPSSQMFELHLTGMQGDVMKESMQVARTLAFELAGDKLCECLTAIEEKKYKYGLHIHVPEGATKKDGPSAGTAITIAIYSRITGAAIRHNVAITGEICLSGRVTAIGGLEEKVLGGIKAGVTHFIYPKENEKDFAKIQKTYGDKHILDGVEFTSVDNIHDAMKLAIYEDANSHEKQE